MNISGVIVKTSPENLARIMEVLSGMTGIEVHGNNDDGRIVITVEQDTNSLTDTLAEIHDVPGVLSAAMIYQQDCSSPV